MKKIYLAFLFALLGFQPNALGCINTSYSRTHEVQITDELVKIIMGQFATHGPAFYEAELVRTDAVLANGPQNAEAQNDRGAALLKLERFKEAEIAFLDIEKKFPGRYKTHANLGVLYKKTGQFQKAIDHTKKALEIKPEGHLGLGDYYLRMLEWRKQQATPDLVVNENFLGTSYLEPAEVVTKSPGVNKVYLRTLIIADRHFSDAYLVLGDVLYTEGNLELAYRCYHQAERFITEAMLKNSDKDNMPIKTVHQRKSLIVAEWNKQAKQKSNLISSHEILSTDVQRETTSAKRWVRKFQEVEAELLIEGKNVDFQMVKSEMATQKVKEPRYLEAGVVKGKEIEQGPKAIVSGVFTMLVFMAVAILAVFLLARRFVF